MKFVWIVLLSVSCMAQVSIKGVSLKGSVAVSGTGTVNNFASRIAGTNVPGGLVSIVQANDATGGVVPQSFDSALPLRSGNYVGQGYCPADSCAGVNHASQDTGLDGQALKLSITSGSTGPDTSGIAFTNFSASPSYTTQFGEGQEFYVQFAEWVDPALLVDANWPGSGGFKSSIVGSGDSPGHDANSCSNDPDEVVINKNETGFNNNMPIIYTGCGGVFGTQSMTFFSGTGSEYLDQPMVGTSHYCNAGIPCACGAPAWCYQASTWMVFQYHIKIGHYNSYDSTVELWASIAGGPSVLLFSAVDWGLGNNGTGNYGKIWLLPYQTSLTTAGANSFVKYDDLIISKRRIPDPNTGVPNAPDSLTTTVVDTTHVTLNWRVNSQNGTAQDDTGFSVERCAGTSQQCLSSQSFAQIGTTAAGASSYADSGLTHTQAYTYRVRASNTAGNSAYTGGLCYRTTTGSCGMMATP